MNVGIDYKNPSGSEAIESDATPEESEGALNTPTTGDYADFTVYSENGSKTKLSDIVSKGKPVIINFWTTWCGYCKSEMPDFNEVYNEFGDEVEFMMIDICGGGQDDMDAAIAYIKEEGFDFPVYYDKDLSALYAYYTTGYPTTIMIDSDANVVYAQSGALSKEALLSLIDQLI